MKDETLRSLIALHETCLQGHKTEIRQIAVAILAEDDATFQDASTAIPSGRLSAPRAANNAAGQLTLILTADDGTCVDGADLPEYAVQELLSSMLCELTFKP